MIDRIPAPDGALNSEGKPVMVFPDGTIIGDKYCLNYLNTKDKEIILYLSEKPHIPKESKGLFKVISYFFNKEKKPEKFIIKEPISQRSMMRLFREKETLIRLLHPSIARVLELFNIGDSYYLVLEYIDGNLMEKIIKETPGFISEKIVLNWILKIIDVLEYIHNINPPFIHRDIKPDNIIITGQGNIKIIDFGLSKIYKKAPIKRGDTELIGTPGFAPPEQLQGTEQTDQRSDIYSLGATMHYLLTNRHPGVSPFEFPPVRSINPAVSENMEKVIEKALQKEMGNRFSTITEMKKAMI